VAEPVDEGVGGPPALLYVPAHPVGGDPQASFALEPRTMSDGAAAVIAFTSVAELVRQLGRYQPWAAFRPEDLQRLAHAIGLERVYVDPKVYPFEMRWAPAHLDQLWG
jgi:SseB protein N-terminal domain